ncbi:hypothetical protein J6590_028529 [Homalodisca vitripennis]|nr:hypothetical protein J6590_028529 [Homalodisca vitripennis]
MRSSRLAGGAVSLVLAIEEYVEHSYNTHTVQWSDFTYKSVPLAARLHSRPAKEVVTSTRSDSNSSLGRLILPLNGKEKHTNIKMAAIVPLLEATEQSALYVTFGDAQQFCPVQEIYS